MERSSSEGEHWIDSHGLDSIDENGNRRFPHPREVSGRWHQWRLAFQWGLLGFFLLLPWLKVGGRPVLLLDVVGREFTVLGKVVLANDFPMLVFLLLGFVITVGVLTATVGRVWCGWACPQTVYIERVYRLIEQWIEGDAIARRNLDLAPWNAEKVGKRAAKWTAYYLASLVVTHTFLGIFLGSDRVLAAMRSSPGENWGAFTFVYGIAAFLAFNFGWLREQFCVIMCPYGKLQSVLMDANSLVVGYDRKRGEPRGSGNGGDCVNCFRCVQVCPTGIDIRNGTQLDCVACTACIDACDDVMSRLKKPQGLIRYTTENALQGKVGRRFGPRVLAYGAALSVVWTGFAYALNRRSTVDVEILKARGAPFVETSPGLISNTLFLEISNRRQETVEVRLTLLTTEASLVSPREVYRVDSRQVQKDPFLLRAPRSGFREGHFKARLRLDWRGIDSQDSGSSEAEVRLVGPER